MSAPALYEGVDVVAVEQVRNGPAIQVVFAHALFDHAVHQGDGAGLLGVHQHLDAHVLVVARVVALVELAAAAEFGAG